MCQQDQDDTRKIARYERAFRSIQVWAEFTADSGDSYEGMKAVLEQIGAKSLSTLKGE